MIIDLILASFTAPMDILTDPQSMLWLLPLAISISVVYKAAKQPKITAAGFIRESALLCGSIVVVMIIAAVVLHALAWLIIE